MDWTIMKNITKNFNKVSNNLNSVQGFNPAMRGGKLC